MLRRAPSNDTSDVADLDRSRAVTELIEAGRDREAAQQGAPETHLRTGPKRNEEVMFVQVITGHATNPTGLREHWQRWERELEPTAEGFLGATAGIADDASFIAMVRFDSEADARRNAAREVQTRWWNELLRHLDDVAIQDSTRTDIWAKGGSDDAGFVQMRQGVSRDPERLRDLYVNQQPVRMGPFRPEVLGGLFAWHGDAGFTLSAYFTSEREARSGENLHEFASFFDDIDAVMQDLTYVDLRDPWLTTASTDLPDPTHHRSLTR
jgi:hypothetical protein